MDNDSDTDMGKDDPRQPGALPEPIIMFHNGTPPRGDAIAQALESASELLKPEVITVQAPDGTQALAYVDGNGLHFVTEKELDQFREFPRYRSGTAVMLDLDSFIAHVKRNANADTAIFADNNRAAPKLTAILDYHLAGSAGAARFGRHRTTHAFPLSDEWLAWTKNDGEAMKAIIFARFLEDHIIDVVPPGMVHLTDSARLFVDSLGGPSKIADPAKLMDIARNLTIHESSLVKQVHNLSSGETQVEFQSEHQDQAGQKVNLPTMFVLGIPVFKGGEGYQIIARLRYRKTGADIVFWYEMWRTDIVFDDAFDGAIKKVETETSQPVFIGHFEA